MSEKTELELFVAACEKFERTRTSSQVPSQETVEFVRALCDLIDHHEDEAVERAVTYADRAARGELP